jgi:phage tail sheath protein FI
MSQINESAIKTPGVYVNEIPSFPPSIAQVATAIPVFIGYTEFAIDSKGNPGNFLKPTRITSLLEYQQSFGGPQKEDNLQIAIVEHHDSGGKLISSDVTASFATGTPSTKYLMFYALQMYFINGGGPCYIVSVNDYATGAGTVDNGDLQDGLDSIEAEDEPTLIVFPDGPGIATAANYYTLQNNALALCAKLQDRFSLIDVFDNTGNTNDNANHFRGIPTAANGIGASNLNYGAAYYPNLITTLIYEHDDADVAVTVSSADAGATVIAATDLAALSTENKVVYNQAKTAIGLEGVNLPPSSTIAGIMATVDATRGVWKAPAGTGIGINAVQKLTDSITDESQENLNIDPGTGKSINAIRAFTGKGILVWGARTLEGNSNDFRYVSVRRFYIMVEESVKKATMAFVFEPNDGNTWVRVRAMIENYLTNLWRLGALAGSKPEQAFYVKVGLGQTMTFQDILEGRMIVEIGMAPVRPAEFIILRFSQIQQQA